MKHTFYSDPGHAWLAVPRAELVELGIITKISHYSYQRGDTVYLEEDCDYSTYAEALKAKGEAVEYVEARQANNSSRIRSYDSFKATPEEIEASAETLRLSVKEFFGI